MLDKLKAVVAGVVGFASIYVARKFGFTIDPVIEGAIVGAIMSVVVWAVPNIDTQIV